MENDLIMYAGISFIVGIVVLYYTIKFAIKDALKEFEKTKK